MVAVQVAEHRELWRHSLEDPLFQPMSASCPRATMNVQFISKQSDVAKKDLSQVICP